MATDGLERGQTLQATMVLGHKGTWGVQEAWHAGGPQLHMLNRRSQASHCASMLAAEPRPSWHSSFV